MKFGAVPLAEARGAILAHGIRLRGVNFRKGRVLGDDDIAALAQAGLERIVVARLESDDITEDEAARRLAAAAAGAGIEMQQPFTGRANLYASRRGLLVFDAAAIEAFNRIDEAITIATLPPFDSVEPRQMVATVKIIPFAVPKKILDAACGALSKLEIRPYRDTAIGLISTKLAGTAEKILDKNRAALEQRLHHLAGRIIAERRVAHDMDSVAAAIREVEASGAELILVYGASAIVDRRDVIPAGVEAAGGRVERFGMPVDPGNLLLLAEIDGKPVVGLPGCARSPKVNGFDFVLQRLLAGLEIGSIDIARMGAGGLLKEIPDRPQPRAKPVGGPHAPIIAGILLAAGRSSRMGGSNKLLAEIGGKPLLRHAADALRLARVDPIIAVTGHMAEEIGAVLGTSNVRLVHNADFAQGLSTSLKAGIAALPEGIDGVLIMLGDMPSVGALDIERMIAAFNPLESRSIIVPTFRGKRGNPVLFDVKYLPEMQDLQGDVGAKHLIGEHAEEVVEVEMTSSGVLVDLDTPEALAAYLAESPKPVRRRLGEGG